VLLLVIALVLAVVSIFVPRYRLLTAAVIVAIIALLLPHVTA